MKDSPLETAGPAATSADERATSVTNARSFATVLKRALRVLFALAVIAATFAILTISMTSTGTTAHKDFIAFWAAGRLLIRHANPYDAAAVFPLEKSAGHVKPPGICDATPPPAAFWLCLLAGLLSPVKAAAFWMLLIVASIVASIRMLWNFHGRPPDQLHLLGYLFAPTFACTVWECFEPSPPGVA